MHDIVHYSFDAGGDAQREVCDVRVFEANPQKLPHFFKALLL